MKKIILAVFILFSLAACSVGFGASGGSNGVGVGFGVGTGVRL
ncbi:lipoprotein [Aggregatibacter actinomycetemcomitans]|nr:lipoprotein [Aggregatibacter actinomycetemcomitans]